MLFTLETQPLARMESSLVLSEGLSSLMKNISYRRLSLAFLKNREITAQTRGVNTTMDISKMLAYGRIPMFRDAG